MTWLLLYSRRNLSKPFEHSSKAFADFQHSAVFRNHTQSSFSTHILVSSIFSIVLATRVNRPDLDKELSKDCKSQAPLANSLAAALRALPVGKPDPFGSRITWDLSWLHLLADIKWVNTGSRYLGATDNDATCQITGSSMRS